MANITGNYEENGKYSGSTVFENFRGCSLGPALVGSKALAQRQLLGPAEHEIIFPFFPQTASRSDGKRHSFTPANLYAAMIL